MATQRLNPLDASWLLVESRDTPMHIAGLMPFSLPDDAGPRYLLDLMADLRAADPFRQGGGKMFSKADRSRFLDTLDRLLRAAQSG